jgi:hypothetical protein
LAGLGVRVSQGGTRSFFLFTGKAHNRQRHSIGRLGIITLAQARAQAKRLLAEQTLGHAKPKTITFSAALAIFEEQKYPELKPRTVYDYKAMFRRHFVRKLGDVRLADIVFEEVTAITDKLVRTPNEQRHALVVGNTFFRWCVRRRFLKHSPLDGVDVPKPPSRKRVLSDEELVAVYRAAERTPWPFGPVIQLLILTGQRRGGRTSRSVASPSPSRRWTPCLRTWRPFRSMTFGAPSRARICRVPGVYQRLKTRARINCHLYLPDLWRCEDSRVSAPSCVAPGAIR